METIQLKTIPCSEHDEVSVVDELTYGVQSITLSDECRAYFFTAAKAVLREINRREQIK